MENDEEKYLRGFNLSRERYYGLRIGDRVEWTWNGKKGTVVETGLLDNNRVYLDIQGKIIKAEAGECLIIEKVEDYGN